MDEKERFRFEYYLFSTIPSYSPLSQAINDVSCFLLAKEIICRVESFITSNKNPTPKEKLEHYKSIRDFLIQELGSNAQLVKDLNNEIAVYYNDGIGKSTKRSFWDDINRIRAIFDLWHKE